jgi:sortase A
VEKLLIGITVPLASLSATFMALYAYNAFRPPQPPSVPGAPLTSQKQPVVYSAPSLLNIPSISVAAPVVATGLTSEGNMDISDNTEQVAWYKLGKLPGEVGTAVVAGHYGWKNGAASIFNRLHELKKGDVIATTGEDGKRRTFMVTRSATYSPEHDAKEVFSSSDGKAHLNLITCQGSWERSKASYSQRLVVFTDLLTE